METATLKAQEPVLSFAETLSNNIRQQRFLKRLTISELARRSGLSRQILYRVEMGNANLRMDSLERLAKALEINVRDLVG